jgi:hypothetical protein
MIVCGACTHAARDDRVARFLNDNGNSLVYLYILN